MAVTERKNDTSGKIFGKKMFNKESFRAIVGFLRAVCTVVTSIFGAAYRDEPRALTKRKGKKGWGWWWE